MANKEFLPPSHLKGSAHVSSMAQYKQMYEQSISDPESFWREIAKDLHWESQPSGKFLDYNFDHTSGPIFIKWMQGAKTNVAYNVLDRHIQNGKGDKIAFYWEGNDVMDEKKITFSELKTEVCRFANVLKDFGVQKGDRVSLYMPMILELVVAMLACARLGVIHSIVFAGYSERALSERLMGCEASLIITADGMWRGTKLINLKNIADEAIKRCKENGYNIDHCIVVRHLSPNPNELRNGSSCTQQIPAKRPCYDLKINWDSSRDKWWHDLLSTKTDEESKKCPPVWCDAEDPLFMLYTSGSTGKPKGVLHTTGGYMLYAYTTFKYVFDYHDDDVFWCTADIGWITGHSYVCYGPLVNGSTSVIFEGVPYYPTAGRFWEIVEKYKVTKFYTAPTAIRCLMKYGDEFVNNHDVSSLKVLGSVGEPINPEAWLWYHNVVGKGKCAVVDTFWQTETGGHVLTPLPGATPTKPGSATFPFFGVRPAILTAEGKEVKGPVEEGYLVFKQPWPGMMRTVYGNHERFETTYFKKFPGFYCTGDGARRDEDDYIWITGRIDDMVNVSGHLISTAEVEAAIAEHSAVAEAAVVSHPHSVKGECTYGFVILNDGFELTEKLITELKCKVRTKIGPFAQPDYIQYAPGLPKTRSGKIMRRILRKIAVGDTDFGDISTLADESVLELILKHRPQTIKA
ncbi:acetyl-coenzyme A synthetase, cytoplasmic isoform X2 [Octopus bimaculoides]|uniref:Acetyl-coenzyme A synthetase n=1 Tax=Octopus bimaculoides TaxID=37653 RepID=A0A0L8HDM0_OCTBM|nr:acetyl-coenzyme A synthetase, cytoplasmic isoform X2 [Octopus bimaculoides]|eukprot:XP_014773580.1 PREDICTED: acetyl-coenzyme A synthetase, cytoplasmic-like isoform X1 [Octopus bimaculoides]